MKLKVQFLIVFLCLFVLASVSPAGDVFVLPDGTTSQTVHVYSGDPMGSIGTYLSGPGAVQDIFTNSPGTKFYTVANTTEDGLVVVDQTLSDVYRSGTWIAPARAGVMTPDGSRVLVAAEQLVVFDAVTDTQLAKVNTGSDPLDVAVSVDSRYAFALSGNSQKLYRVDLTTNTVTATLPIYGELIAVAVGPNNLVYVSGSNRVYVIDPDAMTVAASIDVVGKPNKLYFTPDGLHAVATNRTPVTGVSAWIFELASNSVIGTAQKIQTPYGIVTMKPTSWIPDNNRVLFTSNDTGVIYVTQIPDGGIDVLQITGIPNSPTDVTGIALSKEMPAARYLYYTDDISLHRVDLTRNQVDGTPIPLTGGSFGLKYAVSPSTGVPVATILYNNNQDISEGGTFEPVVVRALDSAGLPVANAPVAFTSIEGVTFEDVMATTNMDGLAMARVNPGELVGPIPVTVTVGTGLTAVFDLSVGGGGGGVAGISIVSGDGQLLGDRYFTFAKPLKVKVRDEHGEPKAGVTVTWAVTEGQGRVTANETTTDANGETSVKFIGVNGAPHVSWVAATITATAEEKSVNFTFTTYPTRKSDGRWAPAPSVTLIKPDINNRDFEGQAGQTLEDAVEVQVVALYGLMTGRKIPNVAVEATTGLEPGEGPIVACAGGYAMTGEDEPAICNLLLGGLGTAPMKVVVGGTFREFASMTVTVTPGQPAAVVIVQGDGQSGDQGATLPTPLVAEVHDAFGNPLPGSPVHWEVVSGAVTLTDVQETADANARVQATAVLGATPGPAVVRVTSGTGVATFNLTVLVNITQLMKVSGDGQSALINQQFPSPLVVELRDDEGKPVEGQPVSFTVSNGSATVDPSSAATDSQGRAMTVVTAGTQPGDITVTAAFPGVDPVTFNLTSRLPGPGISPTSFVNGASGEPGVVPGSVVKIVAPGLAPGIQNCVMPTAQVGALPSELAGVTVQFGPDSAPKWAPIYYVCNMNGEESVAIQAPFDLPVGSTSVTVRVHSGKTTVDNVPVLAVQPGIFETVGADNLRYGVVIRADGSFVSPDNPIARGEIGGVFGTGLGPVLPATGTNQAGLPGQEVVANLVVGINNEGVRVVGGEYAINMIGVYVVYFEVPADTETGPARPLALAVRAADDSLIIGPGSTIAIQ